MMLGMAPDYDHLMVIQKVEVFEHALDSTSGMHCLYLAIPTNVQYVQPILKGFARVLGVKSALEPLKGDVSRDPWQVCIYAVAVSRLMILLWVY